MYVVMPWKNKEEKESYITVKAGRVVSSLKEKIELKKQRLPPLFDEIVQDVFDAKLASNKMWHKLTFGLVSLIPEDDIRKQAVAEVKNMDLSEPGLSEACLKYLFIVSYIVELEELLLVAESLPENSDMYLTISDAKSFL